MRKADILDKYPPKMENVLLILHDFQNTSRWNYLSEKDLYRVAKHLNTTLGVIYGIASYYTMFSLSPRGKHVIRICRSPVCHLTGMIDILSELTKILKIDIGATTADKYFTLETSECLGHCDSAPAMMVDDVLYGNLTLGEIRKIVQHCREDRRGNRRWMG